MASNSWISSFFSSSTPLPSASSTSPGLCNRCNVRPKAVQGARVHDYCSKTCAGQAAGAAQATPGMCPVCKVKPINVSGGRTYRHCSRNCARQGSQAPTRSTTSKGLTGKDICAIPACSKNIYKPWNGPPSRYCGRSHLDLGANMCFVCKGSPKKGKWHYCSAACAEDAQRRGPALFEFPRDHQAFKDIVNQFSATWRGASKCPEVHHVFKVVSTKKNMDAYEKYKATIKARRGYENERRRWHGTSKACNLGENGNTSFCSSPSCALCSILKTSFDMSYFGAYTGWGQFGRGLYTSSLSSTSNGYSRITGSSPFKAMILTKVVVGRGAKVTTNQSTLTQPPAGYDSVIADVTAGLTYDELVVFTNDAIRPSYLLLYK